MENWSIKSRWFHCCKSNFRCFSKHCFIISFLLIGFHHLALGVAAGILSQLIPVVGTFLGGLVPFIASISLGTNAMIATVVVLLAYQIIENYFISPRVTKSTMEIHPAIAVFSTLFGAYTLGGVGAILHYL